MKKKKVVETFVQSNNNTNNFLNSNIFEEKEESKKKLEKTLERLGENIEEIGLNSKKSLMSNGNSLENKKLFSEITSIKEKENNSPISTDTLFSIEKKNTHFVFSLMDKMKGDSLFLENEIKIPPPSPEKLDNIPKKILKNRSKTPKERTLEKFENTTKKENLSKNILNETDVYHIKKENFIKKIFETKELQKEKSQINNNIDNERKIFNTERKFHIKTKNVSRDKSSDLHPERVKKREGEKESNVQGENSKNFQNEKSKNSKNRNSSKSPQNFQGEKLQNLHITIEKNKVWESLTERKESKKGFLINYPQHFIKKYEKQKDKELSFGKPFLRKGDGTNRSKTPPKKN